LRHIRNQQRNKLAFLRGFLGLGHLQAVSRRLLPARAAFAYADDDIKAAFMQVKSVSAALAAVADNSNGVLLERVELHVFIVLDLHNLISPFVLIGKGMQ